MPRLAVPPPTFSPSPYGLLSTVQARYDETDVHWRTGVQWQPLCGDPNSTYDACLAVTGTGGAPPTPTTKTVGVDDEPRGGTPFTVYTEFECSPAVFAERAKQQAEEALTRLESWQVERTFWAGVAGAQTVAYPHLAANSVVRDAYGVLLQTAATEVTGVALDIVEALGQVEQALADCYNGIGVIHIPAILGPALSAQSLVAKQGPTLRTLNGNLVVLGSGYPGTSPAGAAPSAGTTWIYATGAVFAYRSGVEVTPMTSTINRSTNTVRAIAERTYVLGWDCCHIAALVSTGGEAVGAANSPGGP